MWEAFEHAAHYEPRQPHRDHRRQPARPARRDDGGLGSRRVRGARRGVRLERDRDRRPRPRGDRRGLCAGRRDSRPADGRRRPHEEGEGRRGGRGQERLPRQAARRPRRRDRRARRAAGHPDRGREARRRAVRRARRQRQLELPRYELGTEVATRKAYGDALAALGAARPDVVVLDGEVSNSTFAETFAKSHPERYFEMYIAEQQMVAAAVGLQAVGWRPFASTFAAFLSRAYDFARMAAVSRATLVLCGSHAGVSIGEDGPSQMGLEDIAVLPRDPGVDGAASERREPDREARGGAGRHGGNLVPPDAASRDARPVLTGRGVRHRRQPGAALERRRRGRADRRRDHGARGAEGRGRARRGGDRGAGDRPLLDQAARRARRSPPRPRRRAVGSSPSRTTGPRAGSETPSSPRSRTPTSRRASCDSRFARCRDPASPRSASQPRASTPSTSRLLRARSWRRPSHTA